MKRCTELILKIRHGCFSYPLRFFFSSCRAVTKAASHSAEAGQDKSSFTRLENTEIDDADTYHYCYTNSVEPGGRKRDEESDVLIPYERYGEHYLFETENYIYLFAFSGAKKDDACLTCFQKVIDSIQVDAEPSYQCSHMENCGLA